MFTVPVVYLLTHNWCFIIWFFFQISRQMAQDVAGASIQRRSQSLDDEVFLLNLKPI